MCPTDLSGYWQAAAIFVTGLLAVGAAWWVGKRQTAIQERQTEISLLERRYDIIKSIRDEVTSLTLNTSKLPNFEIFRSKIDAAKMLFPDDLVNDVGKSCEGFVAFLIQERVLRTITCQDGSLTRHFPDGPQEKAD